MGKKYILQLLGLALLAFFSFEVIAANNFPTASGITGITTNSNSGIIDGYLMPVVRYLSTPFLWIMVSAMTIGVVWSVFGVYTDMQNDKKSMGDFILSLVIGIGIISFAIVITLYVIGILA